MAVTPRDDTAYVTIVDKEFAAKAVYEIRRVFGIEPVLLVSEEAGMVEVRIPWSHRDHADQAQALVVSVIAGMKAEANPVREKCRAPLCGNYTQPSYWWCPYHNRNLSTSQKHQIIDHGRILDLESESLGVTDVRIAVSEVKRLAVFDDEAAATVERDLWKAVLNAVVRGVANDKIMAKLALTTADINFRRG